MPEGSTARLRLYPPDGAAAAAASFDILCLGTGGGPVEDNLSAYLIKPKQQPWSDGYTSVDGGSCLGAMTRLLAQQPEAFADFDFPATNEGSPLANAGYVFDLLHSFLVTHAHWDHISGLVLASGSGAGQKSVYGSKQTLQNLESAMNGGLWPVLGSYDEANKVPYTWRTMDTSSVVKPSPGLTASIMPLSHGRHHANTSYESSAYFINSESDGRSVLIFGDVEADSVSGEQYNRDIWQEAAKRIQAKRLNTILIECSYTSCRPKAELYGHLSPPYIMEELSCLAGLLPAISEPSNGVSLAGRLSGVNVCLVHIKDPMSFEPSLPASGNTAAGLSLPTETSTGSKTRGKRKQGDAPTGIGSPLSRSTRSRANQLPSTAPAFFTQQAASQQSASFTAARLDPRLPEGFRRKVLQQVLDLEQQHRFGANFFALEQGMRIEC